MVTVLVGYAVSYITRKVTGEEIRPMDPNLFIPPLARKLEKQWDRPLNLKTLTEMDDPVNGRT